MSFFLSSKNSSCRSSSCSSTHSSSDCSRVKRKNLIYLKRKKFRLGNKLNRFRRHSIDSFLNLSKLNEDNKKLIRLIYKSLLKNQQQSFKQIPSISSLTGYQENFNNSKENHCLIEELDRFSSIFLLDEKIEMTQLVENPPIDAEKQKNLKNNKINEDYMKKIEPIQKELMPEWSKIELEEKQGIIDLYSRWETSLENNFNRIKTKQKMIKPVYINYNKLSQKGEFNFDMNKIHLKKMQIDLLEINLETDDSSKIKPNTRVLLKGFKELLNAFDSIEDSKNNLSNTQLYWSNLNKFLAHLSKSILRLTFYVHENANLYKASIGLPPIYVLESDEVLKKDQIHIKIETLYEYVFLCLNQLNINVKKEDLNEDKEANSHVSTRSKRERKFYARNLKLKFYKLVLNCLVRLIQLSCLVRDSIVMKQIRYQSTSLTDCDIYSHFVANECKLIKEYLKEIIQDKI
ncbi:unnamed protein product [Brachionus calyciflorus]|uniref:Uncharacterized protein n=1 Tax=Brachionus calyciflorus TaxID=104777 RepID=A0A814JJU6_9BILA|nr:unnamed protein product [Brachionus calyciflorus]